MGRKKTSSQSLLTLVWALLFCVYATGQQTDETSVFRSSSRLVVLDVVVTDAQNRPVRGLSGRDFKILEDGVEQKLASLDAPSFDAVTAEIHSSAKQIRGTSETESPPGGSSIPARNILVLDELNTGILDSAYGRQSIEKFLRNHGPVLNQPTSLIIVGQDRIEFAHDYTRDAVALRDAMKQHHAELPFSKLTAGAEASVQRLAKTLWVLDQIASANLHFAGRKNVLWIGSGFPELILNDIAFRDREKFKVAIREMGGILFDARVAVYTIDPGGLSVRDGFDDATTDELLFEGLGPQTGGKIIRAQNQLDEVIAETMDDGASYYTLSYYPSNHNWNSKFRILKVVLEGRQLESSNAQGLLCASRLATDGSGCRPSHVGRDDQPVTVSRPGRAGGGSTDRCGLRKIHAARGWRGALLANASFRKAPLSGHGGDGDDGVRGAVCLAQSARAGGDPGRT